jgi:hypothetical protein
MKNKFGQARLDIQLHNDVITVYHTDGDILLSWEPAKGDWEKIFHTLQRLSDIADVKENAIKDMNKRVDKMTDSQVLELAELLNLVGK